MTADRMFRADTRVLRLIAAAVVGAVILIGCFLLLSISRNRDFQVDEVEHLHAAYNLRDGRMIYRNFWQGHPPLLYAMLAPLTDVADPIATYHCGRLLLAIILLGTIALTAACAQRLGGGWAAAGAGGLALFHTTLIERGMEVRPDGPLAFLVMAALAVELFDRDLVRRFSIEALLLGTGVLLTQKTVFPLAAFAMFWAFVAWRERRARLIAQPLLLSAVPFGIGLAALAAAGAARPFLRDVLLSATSAAVRAESRATFGPMFFVVREGARNVVFLILFAAAVAWVVIRRRNDPRMMLTLFLALAAIAALWANPFPWPYTHVTAIPLLAVVAAAGLPRGTAAAAMLLVAATTAPRLLQKAAPSADLQFATLREVARVTPPHATVFDLAGLYFRPDAYRVYAMSGDMLVSYQHGAFPPIVPELRRNAVACVIYNYRTAALPPAEKAFIGAHFTHYEANLFLPGADLSRVPALDFEVLETRRFRYDGGGAITVDGAPFTAGMLARGVHRIAVVRAVAPSRIVVDAPPPVIAGPPANVLPTFD